MTAIHRESQQAAWVTNASWTLETAARLEVAEGHELVVRCLACDVRISPEESARFGWDWDGVEWLISDKLGSLKLQDFEIDEPRAGLQGLDWVGAPLGTLAIILVAEAERTLGTKFGAPALGLLAEFPIPIFGSPPSKWEKLADVGTRGPFVAALAYPVYSDRPVLAVVTAAAGFVIWFARPPVQLARDELTERLREHFDRRRHPDAQA